MKEDFENELRALSPFLADLKKQKKEDGFKAPKFYFDTLADKVIASAQPTKAVAPPQYLTTSSLAERVQIWLSGLVSSRRALAFASVLLVAVSGWYFLKPNPTVPTEQCRELACLPHEEIKTYISENISDFEEEMLIKNVSIAENTEGDALKHLDEKEVEQYLIDKLEIEDVEN